MYDNNVMIFLSLTSKSISVVPKACFCFYLQLTADYGLRDQFLRNEQYMKRCSRASDTSSAYSGSDMMQSSIDDQENVDMEITGLPESLVDSDDEEGYAESTGVSLYLYSTSIQLKNISVKTVCVCVFCLLSYLFSCAVVKEKTGSKMLMDLNELLYSIQ